MKAFWIPQLLVSGMLLWALNPGNPYAYYILLRWVCCAVFSYLAIQAFALDKPGWVWVLGVAAAVYNPLFPVHLTREIWSVINIVTIGVALASIMVPKQGRNLAPSPRDASRRTILHDVGAILDELQGSLNCEAFQVIRTDIEQMVARLRSEDLSSVVSSQVPLRHRVLGCVARAAMEYLEGNTTDVRGRVTTRTDTTQDLLTIYELSVDELAQEEVLEREASNNEQARLGNRTKDARVRLEQFLQDSPEQFKVLRAIWAMSSDALCHCAENVYRKVDHPLPHGPCLFEAQVYLLAELLDQMVSFDQNEETIKRFHQYACHAILFDLHPRLLVNEDLHQIALSRLDDYWDLRSSSDNWGELCVKRVRQLVNHLSVARVASNRVQKEHPLTMCGSGTFDYFHVHTALVDHATGVGTTMCGLFKRVFETSAELTSLDIEEMEHLIEEAVRESPETRDSAGNDERQAHPVSARAEV